MVDFFVFFFWYVKWQVLYVADTRQIGSPAVTFTQGHGLDGPWGMVAGKKQVKVFITRIIDVTVWTNLKELLNCP